MTESSSTFGRTIQFSYIKSTQFRVVHVDGAVGGLTPTGLLHIATYNERLAIPRVTVHPVDDNGKLGDPVSIEAREGIVRELEVDLLMTINVARDLRDWLNKRLDEYEVAIKDVGK